MRIHTGDCAAADMYMDFRASRAGAAGKKDVAGGGESVASSMRPV
jgi:hypothetical protein